MAPLGLSLWHSKPALSGIRGRLSQGSGGFDRRGWKQLARRALGHKVWQISPQLLPGKVASSEAEGVRGGGQSPRPQSVAFPPCPWTKRESWHLGNMTSYLGPGCSFPPVCALVWWVSSDGLQKGIFRCANSRFFACESFIVF